MVRRIFKQHPDQPREQGILTYCRWETSKEGAQLLLDYGIEYDHSMSHTDCEAYYLRTGDTWTNIDYKKKPEDWMKPLVKGQDTGLVEIPANWYVVQELHRHALLTE